jgi:GNAT superfamily N-acetyltransferase
MMSDLGGICGKKLYDSFQIELLYVEKNYRNSKEYMIGKTLLEAAEKAARDFGCKDIWLETFSPRAKGFYEDNKYKLMGQVGSRQPRFILWKSLEQESQNSA